MTRGVHRARFWSSRAPNHVFRVLSTTLHPHAAPPFWAFATLAGRVGRGALRVAILHLEGNDIAYWMSHPIEFTDRFAPVYVTLKLTHGRFPAPGA